MFIFQDFINRTSVELGINLRFWGKGVKEKEKEIIDFIDHTKFELSTSQQLNSSTLITTGQHLIEVDPRYFRPTEVELLIGDPTKSKEKLAWKHKYDFQNFLEAIVRIGVKLFQGDLDMKEAEYEILMQPQ